MLFYHHHPNRSSFERFLMTTTARDGSFKTENIFAPFLRQPWASGRGERGGDYQTWGPLLSSGWSLKPKFTNSPDWWDQIRCQNYKLPHSSLLVRAHNIFPHQTVCSKNNSRIINLFIRPPKKSTDTCFYLFLKVWPLAPGRKMRVFKP